MKLCIIGAGRVDISHPGHAPDIKDPFLSFACELCDHFDSVSVEINTPLFPLEGNAASAVLGRLQLGMSVRYSSFSNYFVNLRNFSPSRLAQLSVMIKSADAVLLRIPGPVVCLAAVLCRWHCKTYVTLVASDLHQIVANLSNARSRSARIKGWMMTYLVAFLTSSVIKPASRRMYLSAKMQTDYGDNISSRATLFTTSIVQKVHPFRSTQVDRGVVRLIYAGRLVAEKGSVELVDICDRLAVLGLTVEIDIVGDGREYEAVMAGFLGLGHPNLHFTMHGWISDRGTLAQLMLAADFCLLPSHNEGTPKVIYEAWACSTIFVGTRVGGIPAAVQDGIDGLLFDVGDTMDAAAKISTMISNPAQIDRMNQVTVRKVESFTLQATAKKLADEIIACRQ